MVGREKLHATRITATIRMCLSCVIESKASATKTVEDDEADNPNQGHSKCLFVCVHARSYRCIWVVLVWVWVRLCYINNVNAIHESLFYTCTHCEYYLLLFIT